jgi:hypothetical protein
MKGGNTSEILGYDSENVSQYGSFDMTGGKKKGKGKKSQKFDDFDFEKEWKEFEESYNQKYGGASKKKTSSSTKKKRLVCKFGKKRRFVFLLENDTLFPMIGFFPVT